jgi:DNA repair exonuclease SbcCD ATPase subunit
MTRNDTDKNIRKVVGTLDDFLLSSMSSQHGALQFINEGTTRRKEIFAKFLDLEVFEKKFKLSKEDSADMKGALKRLEERDYNAELAELQSSEARVLDSLGVCSQTLMIETERRDNFKFVLDDVANKIESVPPGILDIVGIKKKLSDKRVKAGAYSAQNVSLSKDCAMKESVRIRMDSFINEFDVETYRKRHLQIEDLNSSVSEFQSKLDTEQSEATRQKKKIKMLADHEYDPDCKYCCENKFVKDAHLAKSSLPTTQEKIGKTERNLAAFQTQVDSLEPERVKRHLTRYEDLMRKSAVLSGEISDCRLQVQKNKTSIIRIEKEITELEASERLYEQNRDAIENLEALLKDRKIAKNKLAKSNGKISSLNNELMDLHKEHGSVESKIENLQEAKGELIDLQKRYAAYDLYMRCMHSNGIAYDIIKKKLPVINEEIAKVLANIVDFEIFFEDDGKKMNVFIKHACHEARPLEMGSGAEKTLAAMAIRLSLLSVSSLPKGDLFILDEPGTALDEENMEGFIRILDLIKTYFKTVLLISHLDSLKDCVDTQITIDKSEGYAYVNQ